MENSAILRKIKNTRLIRGINQVEIAKNINVSIPTYSRFERGLTRTNLTILHKVCDFLDVEIYKSDKSLDLDLINEGIDIDIKDIVHLKSPEKIKIIIDLLNKQKKINSLLTAHFKELLIEEKK